MDKQKKQFIALILVILFGFMYAYIQFLFTPQWSNLNNLSAEIAQRQAHLERLEENYKILSTVKQNAQDLTILQTELKERIPTDLDKPDIMMIVYTMAKDNGLSPGTLSFESVRQEGETMTMGMGFTCTGSRENINNLVEQFLEGSKYILVLDSISYSGSEELVSADMRLTAYALNF